MTNGATAIATVMRVRPHRGLHDASRRQYIEDCVTGRLDRRTLTMLGG